MTRRCWECRIVRWPQRIGPDLYPASLRIGDVVHRRRGRNGSGFTACGLPWLGDCTGVSARWCPVHGACRCGRTLIGYVDGTPMFDAEAFDPHADLDDPLCALHGSDSLHAIRWSLYAEGVAHSIIETL